MSCRQNTPQQTTTLTPMHTLVRSGSSHLQSVNAQSPPQNVCCMNLAMGSRIDLWIEKQTLHSMVAGVVRSSYSRRSLWRRQTRGLKPTHRLAPLQASMRRCSRTPCAHAATRMPLCRTNSCSGARLCWTLAAALAFCPCLRQRCVPNCHSV